MSTSTILYTSETGVETEAPVIVEHVASKTLRMTDPAFGLKTAAKLHHDKVERESWQLQRALAISKQRDKEATKREAQVRELDASIAKLATALMTGTSSDPIKARETMTKLEERRRKLTA